MNRALALLLSVAGLACGNPDSEPGLTCGPNGECPSGFTCEASSRRCLANSGSGVDAAPLDAQPPDTELTAAPAALGNASRVSFEFQSNTTAATFECRVKGGDFAVCASPFSVMLDDGEHTFEVRAIAGGAADPTPATFVFVVDTIAPETTIDAVAAELVTFHSEDGATFRCWIDDASETTCTSPASIAGAAPGEHTFHVRAIDLAGNEDATPATRAFVVALLDTTLTSAPPATTRDHSATFTFAATRPDATFACSLDGAPPEPCTSPATFSELATGSHTFSVVASAGGETDATPARSTWTIDPAGLELTITGGAPGGVSGATVTFTYTVLAEPGVTYACGLDGEFLPCQPGMATFEGLVHGSMHTFSVRASDASGHEGPPASRSFTVDTSGPVVLIVAPTSGTTMGPSGHVTLDPGSSATMDCTLDQLTVPCTLTGFDYTDAASGPHTVTATGRDAAGMTGATASVTFNVDAAPPTVTALTVTNPTPGTLAVKATANDPAGVASLLCRVDGGTARPCGGNGAFFDELSPGAHLVDAYGVDTLGNSGLSAPTAGIPSVHAAVQARQASGVGHLVLIGHDFTGGSPYAGVLTDAVGLAQAASFTRPLSVVALVGPQADAAAAATVHTILGDVTYREAGSLTDTGAALAGADVLVIHDQNGQAVSAATWRAPLTAYFEDGGVVVVLDGTHGAPTPAPSRTYRILDPELLDITGTQAVPACVSVPCNDRDPLATEAPICNLGTSAVAFVTREPWITFAGQPSPGTDAPTVLHRWFGSPSEGPVGVHDDVTQEGDGQDVYFQGPAGQALAHCTLLSNGTAVHAMTAGGSVSVGSPPSRLLSILSVEPLDELGHPPVPTSQPTSTTGDVMVDLPGAYPGATLYIVRSCGGSGVTFDEPTPAGMDDLSVEVGCLDANDAYVLIAEAYADDDSLLGYTFRSGVKERGGGTIALPAWKDVNLPVSIDTGSLDDIPAHGVWYAINLIEAGASYQVANSDEFDPPSPSFDLWADATFDAISSRATLFFTGGGMTERIARGRVPASVALDEDDFLPRLRAYHAATNGAGVLSFGFSVDGAAPSSVVGGLASVTWSAGGTKSWQLAFRPGVTSVTAPPPYPGAPYWPPASTTMTEGQVSLMSATFLDGFGAYRRSPFDAFTEPDATFTRRVTSIVLP